MHIRQYVFYYIFESIFKEQDEKNINFRFFFFNGILFVTYILSKYNNKECVIDAQYSPSMSRAAPVIISLLSSHNKTNTCLKQSHNYRQINKTTF